MSRLARLLFSDDPSRRFALGIWGVSAGSYLFYTLAMMVNVQAGHAQAAWVARFAIAATVINVTQYLVARLAAPRWQTGGAARIQLYIGVAMMWFGYAVMGAMAVTTLVIAASHMVYAIFSFKPRHVWRFAAGSLLGLGAVMLACHAANPVAYDAAAQLNGYAYTCIVIVLITLLSNKVAAMHSLMRRQAADLKQALARVEQLATRDELTQLPNRRHLGDLLATLRQRAMRGGEPLCLALLDIDRFKAVNDHYGHAAGDAVLRGFAQAALNALRASDVIGRWGGEEFLLALPDTLPAESEVALARLRAALATTRLWPDDPSLTVTFSAGLVRITPGETVDAAIERADRALYDAKHGGRDRVVLA